VKLWFHFLFSYFHIVSLTLSLVFGPLCAMNLWSNKISCVVLIMEWFTKKKLYVYDESSSKQGLWTHVMNSPFGVYIAHFFTTYLVGSWFASFGQTWISQRSPNSRFFARHKNNLKKKDFLPKKKIGATYALHKQLDNKWRDQIMDLAHAVVPLY
jgi:hypothetical protein